ncbi:MAG: ankyrin repeat domain-containing protein [Leptospiraceae bacterium]|nr:ankyrin repeat domain-containing protein [Leptospiraceae bacterium]
MIICILLCTAKGLYAGPTEDLCYWVGDGALGAVKDALKRGASPNAYCGKKGDYPVIIEASRDAQMLRLLIEAGADVNATNSIGETALTYAANGGRIECVRILLKAGADPNRPTHMLADASAVGKAEIATLLLKAGADINAPGTMTGGTPLDQAIASGHNDIARMLLDAGADPNVQSDRGAKGTALITASRRGDTEMVALLLEAGANPALKDRWGHDALHYATEEGFSEIETMLRNR